MAVRPSVSTGHQPLTVRFQVWHRSEYRRNYDNNQYLAHILFSSGLQGWTVEPAQLKSGDGFGDDFVPIEANLHWRRDNLALASATLRMVVNTIELHIPEIFNRQESKPLFVNVYPIGDAIPDNVRQTFTHSRAMQSLEVVSRAYASSCSASDRDFVAKRMCMLLGVPLDTLGLFKIYLQVRFGEVPSLEHINKFTELIKKEMKNGVLSEWLEGFGEQRSVVSETAPKEVEALWNKSLASFWHVQLLSNQVQGCIENLSKGRAISNQDLLDNLVLMQRAVVHFSQYQSHIQKLTGPLLEMHGSDPCAIDSKASILAGAVVLSFMPGFSPLSAFIWSAGSVKLTVFCQRLQKRRTIQNLGNVMRDFGKHLQEAQVALAVTFCKQVLKVRLDSSSFAARSDTLKQLGVDVDHLCVQQFGDDHVVKALELFYESYQTFRAQRDKVRDDAGLRESIMIGQLE